VPSLNLFSAIASLPKFQTAEFGEQYIRAFEKSGGAQIVLAPSQIAGTFAKFVHRQISRRRFASLEMTFSL